jgi:hypothetical protein
VHLDQMAHDGQPQSEPAVLSSESAVGLSEAIEYIGEEFLGDALPAIGDSNAGVRSYTRKPDVNVTVIRRKLYRI